jgi:hypothetical protein
MWFALRPIQDQLLDALLAVFGSLYLALPQAARNPLRCYHDGSRVILRAGQADDNDQGL